MLIRFLDSVKNPPGEFTPIPFWFFNDEPDEEKIAGQLTDYVEKGVYGIIIHPRIGIPEKIQYLSESYFNVVKFVVRTADRLGMKVVLYDEGMYPSGSAHGLVVQENAEYASRGICLSESAEKNVITRFSNGRYLVYDFTHGTIRGIHYGEDDGEAGAPRSADILNPNAVDAFIRLTHERYYQELKEYFGSTIIAFFTDEPCPLGRNTDSFKEWAPGMEEEILAHNGRLEELEGLFRGEENVTTRLYHKLIKKHLRETYYARLSGWCESHGVSLMGHPEMSDDVEEQYYFHIPGQDLIMRRVAPESGGIREFDSVQAKLPADIARYLGKRRNANECFGVCGCQDSPWYFRGYDMKWYINWLGIRGVNLFVPHAFYYSVEGRRKEERPPDVGPNNIWWPHYRLFSNYMKRISYLMTDSLSFARVVVLCDNNRVPVEEIAALYENQIDFHYLPIAMLENCELRDGRLCISSCCFDVVIDVHGYAKNESYAEQLAGVRIVEEAMALCGKSEADGCDYRTVVTTKACPNLRTVHMQKEEVVWYLLSNEGEETIETDLYIKELKAGKKPFLINLWDASAEPVIKQDTNQNGHSYIRLQLRHCEMKLLLILNEAEESMVKKEWAESGLLKTGQVRCLGDWTDKFEPVDTENIFESCIRGVDAIVSCWENTAVYQYVYIVQNEKELTGTEVFAVYGEEMAECICNGAFAGVSFYSPHVFQVGPLLKEGKNEIFLRFTGNAVNQYGDVKVPFGAKK